jgi:hypothetical protein
VDPAEAIVERAGGVSPVVGPAGDDGAAAAFGGGVGDVCTVAVPPSGTFTRATSLPLSSRMITHTPETHAPKPPNSNTAAMPAAIKIVRRVARDALFARPPVAAL